MKEKIIAGLLLLLVVMAGCSQYSNTKSKEPSFCNCLIDTYGPKLMIIEDDTFSGKIKMLIEGIGKPSLDDILKRNIDGKEDFADVVKWLNSQPCVKNASLSPLIKERSPPIHTINIEFNENFKIKNMSIELTIINGEIIFEKIKLGDIK